MTGGRPAIGAALAAAGALSMAWLALPGTSGPVLAQGVGGASWTPIASATTIEPSRFLVDGDALTFRTEATWDPGQADGLGRYLRDGLRYTHEVNDRAGRLSATGYWASDYPDPAFDRDDDDGDGRWEEAEITAGRPPQADRTYTTLIQFSRWHPKRQEGDCAWAWDLRLGEAEVLSQLSRELLGEWQAERYTPTYAMTPYPRVEPRPDVPEGATSARCHEAMPGAGQDGVVVTFAHPIGWADFAALPVVGSGRWTAFEAIGSRDGGSQPWTCGGPVLPSLALGPCRDLGVAPDGVVAAVGYFDGLALDELRAAATVARVAELRDAVTGLLFDVGGFGVERPGLTVDDSYWELQLPETRTDP